MLFENIIRKLIREEIQKVLFENTLTESFQHYLTEMGKINSKETYGYFPANKYELKIWSNDHEPPHLHARSKDGWNIVVSIEDGSILKVENFGKDSTFYKLVEDYFEDWLDMPNGANPKRTNREIAYEEWEKVRNARK